MSFLTLTAVWFQLFTILNSCHSSHLSQSPSSIFQTDQSRHWVKINSWNHTTVSKTITKHWKIWILNIEKNWKIALLGIFNSWNPPTFIIIVWSLIKLIKRRESKNSVPKYSTTDHSESLTKVFYKELTTGNEKSKQSKLIKVL